MQGVGSRGEQQAGQALRAHSGDRVRRSGGGGGGAEGTSGAGRGEGGAAACLAGATHANTCRVPGTRTHVTAPLTTLPNTNSYTLQDLPSHISLVLRSCCTMPTRIAPSWRPTVPSWPAGRARGGWRQNKPLGRRAGATLGCKSCRGTRFLLPLLPLVPRGFGQVAYLPRPWCRRHRRRQLQAGACCPAAACHPHHWLLPRHRRHRHRRPAQPPPHLQHRVAMAAGHGTLQGLKLTLLQLYPARPPRLPCQSPPVPDPALALPVPVPAALPFLT